MNQAVPRSRSFRRFSFYVLLLAMTLAPISAAGVTRVEVISREVAADWPAESRSGPYEIIKGVVHFEVDPDHAANGSVTDLKLAPRNARGRVEFSADFELHKPVDADRGNHRLVYFVNNRGHRMAEWHFNHGVGRNWLYSRGWSYLWSGWNADAIPSDRKLNIRVPVATDGGKTITGKIHTEIISYADDLVYERPLVWGDSIPHPPVSLDNSLATLTARQYRWTEPVEIPREQWAFARLEDGEPVPDPGYLYIEPGFKPGWLYDLVYEGKEPRLTGLGLAAIRDVVSFFRYEKSDGNGFPNPLAGFVDHTYAWGHSQSARLLYHFLYQDFNGDEQGRQVLDGVLSNCGGGGKGLFNSRFAQPTRHGSHHEDTLYPIDFFPFATVEQEDPLTGERGDALARPRASGFLPRIFFVNSSTDYWTRAASLLHTDVEGKRDAAIDPSVRIYSVAGRAHVDSRIGILGRALLTALDEWVSRGVEPPSSEVPRISDGTLVSLEEFREAFPAIPGSRVPDSYYQPYRLDPGPRWDRQGIADNVPSRTGPRYVALVPQVDADGNEIAGIRLPEIEAPLATFTGWSLRTPSYSNTLRRNAGKVWPLARTAEEHEKTGDPRRSILERHPTKADYLFEVAKSLLELRRSRFLLEEDIPPLLAEAARQDYWPVSSDSTRSSVEEVSVHPAEVSRGETALLRATFAGPPGEVIEVEAVVREASRIRYALNDDGRDGDEKAGDDVWTVAIPIVPDAVPGTYNLDIRALDRNWDPIFAAGDVREGVGAGGSVVLTIKPGEAD